MAGLAGLTDKFFLGGRDTSKDFSRYFNQFDALNKSGTGLTDEGLGDLRDLSGDYQDLIKRGGLTPALSREFDVQQGRVSDDAIRAGRSFNASIAQQAAQNGGFLSPAAQAELARRNAADTGEQEFAAHNAVSFERAKVAQEATTELQDRILRIADMIRTTGLTREQQARLGQLNLLGMASGRNKDINSGLRSWAGLFAGGAGGS